MPLKCKIVFQNYKMQNIKLDIVMNLCSMKNVFYYTLLTEKRMQIHKH